MITWWMKLGGNLPLGHDALRFLINGTGSFICPVADTAGHTKAFIYPVMDNRWGGQVLLHMADSNLRPVRPHQPPDHPKSEDQL